jgi:tRNA (guanine10-N2)-dimethyltransferase
MAILVELSGEQLELAGQEAWVTASDLAGRDVRVLCSDGPALVLQGVDETAGDLAARLGLAHFVSDQAVTGDLPDAVEMAGSLDIGGARSFRVRVRRSDRATTQIDPKALAAEVGRVIHQHTGTDVDLERPEAEVRVLLARRVHAGILRGSVDRKGMDSRAVRHRPFSQPVSIHPKFARAMVNLARVPVGGCVLDPFCGTGGMLMEAALMGFRAWGSDIDPRMVEGSRLNLENLGLDAQLDVSDVADAATLMDDPPSAIVTDPPYGRSTAVHGQGTGDVLSRLYSMAADALPPRGRLVVCLPSTDLLPGEESPLKVTSRHSIRVHRSLTRHVCVLES